MIDTVLGYDDDSMDSETSSVASYRTDRTPATPDDDLDEVRYDSISIGKDKSSNDSDFQSK